MTDEQILNKIGNIQEAFGMSNGRLSEILEMPLTTLKQKKYHKKYRFTDKDLDKLIDYIKTKSKDL